MTTSAPQTHCFEWRSPTEGMVGRTGLEFLLAMARGELPQAPFHSALALSVAQAEEGFVKIRATPGPHHHNLLGTVHGGYIGSLLDTALGCAVLSTLDAATTFTTLELHVNMVRALRGGMGEVFAEGRIVHRGRQIATSEAKVLDPSGKLYAHGTTTCMVLAR